MDFQLPVGPNETIPLRITEKQRKLLVEKVPLPQKMADKLRFGLHEDNLLVFEFTLDELEEFVEHIGAAANQTTQKKLNIQLGSLYDHVVEVLEAYTDLSTLEEEYVDDDDEQWEGSPLDLLPPPIADELERLMEAGKIRTPKQLERTLHDLAEKFNAQPLDELQGLNMNQVLELVECDWLDPKSPIHLDTGIPLAELQGAEILLNLRTFLRTVEEAGGVKLTPAKKLNRKFISTILDALILPQGSLDELRGFYKTIDEDRVETLGRIRWLAETLRLARHAKGLFLLTKKGRAMLDDAAAGLLMANLFSTHMRYMNLGVLDFLPECPELEETMGFTLYCLKNHAQNWTPLDKLADTIFVPAVKVRMEDAPPFYEAPLVACADRRIVRPLALFGLLEYRTKKDGWRETITTVRTTPLFDRLIHFGEL